LAVLAIDCVWIDRGRSARIADGAMEVRVTVKRVSRAQSVIVACPRWSVAGAMTGLS